MSTKFWTTLFGEFKLNLSHVEFLDDIEMGKEDLNKQLMDHLDTVQSDNPAGRKIAPLLAYLPRCGPMNYTELYLSIQCMAEGPKVSQVNSMKMHMALLVHMARIALPSVGV